MLVRNTADLTFGVNSGNEGFNLVRFAIDVPLCGFYFIQFSWFFHKRKVIDYEQFKVSAENQNKQYELMSGIRDIKLNGYEEYKLQEWRELQERQYRMSQKGLKLGQI